MAIAVIYGVEKVLFFNRQGAKVAKERRQIVLVCPDSTQPIITEHTETQRSRSKASWFTGLLCDLCVSVTSVKNGMG